MSYLADACALLSYFGDAGRDMTAAGHAAMQGEVAVSSITVWELIDKASRRQLPPLPTQQGSFARYLAGLGFGQAPFGWMDAEIAGQLPPIHRDPMDRMLIATARRADLTIITADGIFADYGVRTVW